MIVCERTSYEVKSKVKVGLYLELVIALFGTWFSYQRKVGEKQLNELINEFYVK